MEFSQISTMSFDTSGNDSMWTTVKILNFMSVTNCRINVRTMSNSPWYKYCFATYNRSEFL